MSATVLVGTQWGDEGKGKVTDLISGDFDVVCRYAGGANAGHTVIANGHKLALHQVPSGVMYRLYVLLTSASLRMTAFNSGESTASISSVSW